MSRWGVLESDAVACLSRAQKEVCLWNVLCTQGHLISACRWIRGDTLLSGMQNEVLSLPAIWTLFIKKGQGRKDGHGCICLAVLHMSLGHLMPIPRWHICLIKCKPTSLSLLGPSWWWLWRTGTCRESPVNMVCKGRWWLPGNAQMKTNALLSFYGPRLCFH